MLLTFRFQSLLLGLWLSDFLDDLTVLRVAHENGKLSDVIKILAASLGVLELASDVGEPVSEEDLLAIGLFAEDFHVNFRHDEAGTAVKHLEFSKLLVEFDLKRGRVESLELLNAL